MITMAWKMVDEHSNTHIHSSSSSITGNCNKNIIAQQKTYDFIWYAFLWIIFCFFRFLYNESNAKKRPADAGINSNEKHRNLIQLSSLLYTFDCLYANCSTGTTVARTNNTKPNRTKQKERIFCSKSA